jgi:Xaa-Pro aminopeptidase
VSRFFSDAEYDRRWTAVVNEVVRRRLDTVVIWGRAGGQFEHCGDILYLSNHFAISAGADSAIWNARSFAALIVRPGHGPELHIDEPDPRMNRLAVRDVRWSSDPVRAVGERLRELGISGRVGFVGTNFFPVKYYQQLSELCPRIDWHPEDDLVKTVRKIKSAAELDCYRHAGQTASLALTRLMSGLIAGEKESVAAGAASQIVVERGGRIQLMGTTHGEHIGYQCTEPLTGYSQLAPRPGDLVAGMIHGPMYQGYYLDPAREWVCGGAPSGAQRGLIEATVEIIEELRGMIRPGVRLIDAARRGDELTARYGGDPSPTSKFFPFYGHGVGLFFETPRIGSALSAPDDVFEEGMVLGVEAFLAKDGVGSCLIEDNVIVRAHGVELLTTTPLRWDA